MKFTSDFFHVLRPACALKPGMWLLMLLGLLLAGSLAHAQEEAAAPAESEGFSSLAAIEERLLAVQQEKQAATVETAGLLEQLEAALLQHQEAIEYLVRVQAQAQQIKQSIAGGTGLTQQPPYSIGFADGLRSAMQALQRQKQAVETRLRVINQALEDYTAGLGEHQRLQRQYLEQAERGSKPEEREQGVLAAASEELQSRIAAEDIARIRIRRDTHYVLADILEDQIAHKQNEIESLRGKVEFSQAEFEQILAGLEQQHQALRAQLQSGNAVTGSGSVPGSDIDSQLTWKLEFLGLEKDFWTQMFRAFNSKDPSERASAIDRLRKIKRKADDWLELIELQVRELAQARDGLKMIVMTQQDLDWVAGVQEQITYSLDELAGEGVKGSPLTTRLWSVLLSIWDLELYLVEETASIGGQKVTTFRAITLGKLLRLVFILALGWFALGYLSRLVRRLVAKRDGVSTDTVESAGNWTFGIGLALLIIIALNRVHIPFTAFAFLGGTLAIGIGFGAQTLLKNFISGIILSFERPFRIGDMVQVEDITGRIQKIGLRASVIRHFDGIDTVVPNSTLLENRVSNWTFGDTNLRGRIEVGVAYGSPTRDVARCLLKVAEDHGLVLDKPKPEVRFENFGDSTLLFSLLFWFDTTKAQRDPLASDLRFMIDKEFADNGIVMAFPQRDLHFDSDKPLRVELSRSSNKLKE